MAAQQYSCLDNSMGTEAWLGYSPRGLKESGTTERLMLTHMADSCCCTVKTNTTKATIPQFLKVTDNEEEVKGAITWQWKMRLDSSQIPH